MKTIDYLLLSIAFSIFVLNQSAAQVFSDKLEDVIRSAYPHEKISAVIKMRGSIDVENLRSRTEGISKIETRALIIAEFDDIVQTYQRELLDYLEIMKIEGSVDNFVSIAITNKIVVKATTDVFENIRNRDDFEIAYIEIPQRVLLDNTWNVERINAPNVWNSLGFNGHDIKVAILDTGIDWKHTDLVGNIWQNLGEDSNGNGVTIIWNGSDWVFDPGDLNGIDDDNWDNNPTTYIDDLIGWNFDNNSNNPMDDESHGTFVAGISSGNGSAGMQTGVAPNSKIMSLKVFDSHGDGVPTNVLLALEYAIKNGADVTNSSFGWRYGSDYEPGSEEDPRADFRMAYDVAAIAGIVSVVAAGNEGGGNPPVPHNIRTPGDVPSVITVGATDVSDEITYWSSTGPVSWSDVPEYGDYPYPPGLLKPDVSAPGIDLFSTLLDGGYFFDTEGGTSLSSPHVVGVTSLLLQASPALLPSQLKNILERTSVDFGIFGKDPFYGSGRIDALNPTVVYKNKSINSDATGSNGSRRVVKDSNNHYHLVFGSGNNIWYRKSTNTGETWSSPELLFITSGQNNYPSIAYHNNYIFVTWQQYIGFENNLHLYKVEGVYKQISSGSWMPMYINNDAIGFSTPTNLLPVLVAADNVDNDFNSAQGAPEVMIVFRKPDGIYHINVFYTQPQESGTSYIYQQLGETTKITGTASGYSNPSITANNYGRIIVTCQSSTGTLHAYRTTGDSWFSYSSSIFNTQSINYGYKNSSIATDVTGDFNIVWEATNEVLQKVILHRRLYYFGIPVGPITEIINSDNSKQPSVFGYSDINNGISIYWHNDLNIKKAAFDGIKWGGFKTIKTNSVYVNSINSGMSWQDVYAWTGAQGPLYDYGVKISQPLMGKQNNIREDDSIQVLTYRRTEFQNELSNISLSLQMGNFKLITQNGEEYPLDPELLEPEFSFNTLSDILYTMKSGNIFQNISFEKIMVDYKIRAQNVNLMQINNNNRPRFNFVLSNRGNGDTVTSSNEIIINSDSTIQVISGTVEIPINGYNNNNTLIVAMQLQGIKQEFLNYNEGVNLINSYVLNTETIYKYKIAKQSEITTKYSLAQNYPNPFNLSTQIQYSIVKDGLVTLKVFDIIGREIKKLVNEEKTAGTYSIEFDATNLSSGIYFYSIRSGNFYQTRKMVFVK